MKIFNLQNYIESLNDDSVYYDKNSIALSASTLKKYSPKYPEKYKKPAGGGFIHPLEFGQAFHEAFLEKTSKYDLRTFDAQEGEGLTKDDEALIQRLYGATMMNDEARSILMHPDAEYEVPCAAMYDGWLFKCKLDIELNGEIYDIKTTNCEDEESYRYVADHIFLYPLSAYHYFLITQKPMHYICVSKTSGKVWIERTDKEYYIMGSRMWEEAFNEFKKNYKN